MNDSPTIAPVDALAVSTLSAEFGYLVDHGRATECLALFSAEARLIFGPGSPKPGTLAGLEEINAFLVARQAQQHVTTRHVASNFRLQYLGPDELRLESLLTVYRSDSDSRQPVVSIVADVVEIFRRTAGSSWKIAERLTTPVFMHHG